MGRARRKDKSPARGDETPEAQQGPRAPASPEAASQPEAPTQPEAAPQPQAVERWRKPQGLGRRGWAVLVGLLLVFQFPLLHYALRGPAPTTAEVPYQQDFSDPGVVARDFYSTGGHWRVVDGLLLSPGVKNNPLWLQAALPENVAIDFDVRSESPQGDIKVEVFGDGTDHASGYVLIHGGWNNSLSIIARMDEHGPSLQRLRQQAADKARELGVPSTDLVALGVLEPDTRMRVEAHPYPVQPGRTYHWRIERRGTLLRWLIDGKLFMDFDDPFALRGPGHDRFGFSSWEAQLSFDNLRIEPL